MKSNFGTKLSLFIFLILSLIYLPMPGFEDNSKKSLEFSIHDAPQDMAFFLLYKKVEIWIVLFHQLLQEKIILYLMRK